MKNFGSLKCINYRGKKFALFSERMIIMTMKKLMAAAAAAVMTFSALPAAEVSAYTIEGYNETVTASEYAAFRSVEELAGHLEANDGSVTLYDPGSGEFFAIEGVESLWFPAGFSDKADSVNQIIFTEEYTSVNFVLPYSEYTLYAYSSDTAGKIVYDSTKSGGEKKKVNGRTVWRNTMGFVTSYCWKQAGTYFLMDVTGSGSFSDCTAEEYIIPEYTSEGLKNIGGKLYYVHADGSYYVGWKTLNGKKYFFGMDGAALTKSAIVGNVRYTFGADGVCTGVYTGWVLKEGYKYYYKNGRYVTGVNKISGKTYTFNENGILMY